ncbi:MAG: LytTR family transcriptional regulator DNA-binding domain-containing protein [Rhodobacter sp.]|nr:LytTR family transcriptional regulator DNA-binding domain-containing protein [Rhodobacter sp.]
MASGQVWTLLLCASVVTGFAGPFETAPALPLLTRVFYWTLILLGSTLVLSFLSYLAHRLNARRRLHWATAAFLAGVVAIGPLLVFVCALSWLFMGETAVMDRMALLAQVAVPTVVLNMIVNAYVPLPYEPAHPRAVAALDGPAPVTTSAAVDDWAPFFELLPSALGRDVICIRADDHYVEVTTPRGTERLLMRLRDAEASLTGLPGLRVHRSWWVNLDHVEGLARTAGGGAELLLSTGGRVPVSRAQRAAVRSALDNRR